MSEETRHEVDLLLTCNHIVIEDLEAAVFTPAIGERRTCNVCGREVRIAKVGQPMYKTGEYKPMKKNKKG